MGLLGWVRGRGAPRDDVDEAPRQAASLPRERVVVEGRVSSVVPSDPDRGPCVTVLLDDRTGPVSLVFLGRRSIGGIAPGTLLRAEGRLGTEHGVRRILNPAYTLLEVSRGKAD